MSRDQAPELAERIKLLPPPLLSTQRSSWEQGICAQTMLERHRFFISAEASPMSEPFSTPYDFKQWLYALAHEAVVRQSSDGRLAAHLNGDGTSDTGALNPACIGETLEYNLSSLEIKNGSQFPPAYGLSYASLLEGVERMLEYIMESCPHASIDAGAGNAMLYSHRTVALVIWSDSIYMLPPFLVSAAVFHVAHNTSPNLPGAHAFLELGLQQIVRAAAVLQSPTGEWAHVYDLSARELKRAAFRGVGNGWVCCGIVRVLSILVDPLPVPHGPMAHCSAYADLDVLGLGLGPTYGELLPLLRQAYAILTRTRCPRGHFPNMLGDARTFAEVSLGQMLACALFRLVDRDLYSPRFSARFGSQARARMRTRTATRRGGGSSARSSYAHFTRAATDHWGFVRGVCGSPTFDAPGTAGTAGAVWRGRSWRGTGARRRTLHMPAWERRGSATRRTRSPRARTLHRSEGTNVVRRGFVKQPARRTAPCAIRSPVAAGNRSVYVHRNRGGTMEDY
ncbi:hypothetical protein BD413DRAFT_620864 [Trametes elegans]|nr:hypothetical protein BD413DRAFT_620864 [Trametes elegans]